MGAFYALGILLGSGDMGMDEVGEESVYMEDKTNNK